MSLVAKTIKSPVGPLTLVATNTHLTGLLFSASGHKKNEMISAATKVKTHPILSRAEKQLREYFSGTRTDFDLPLAPHGTAFQKKVWKGLQKIPHGHMRSYGELASLIKEPKAARAVGMANNRNPIAIIIPCHRVIGANGKLVGYGGGLNKKAFLLKQEGCSVAR